MSTLQDAWGNFQGGVKSALNQWTALRLAVVSEPGGCGKGTALAGSRGCQVATDRYLAHAMVISLSAGLVILQRFLLVLSGCVICTISRIHERGVGIQGTSIRSEDQPTSQRPPLSEATAVLLVASSLLLYIRGEISKPPICRALMHFFSQRCQ